MTKTALIASFEKDENLLRLGNLLKKEGWTILASAGSAKFLNENDIRAQDVAEIVGPPILGHRVVTLARPLFAGLLARDEELKELEGQGFSRIDLVYCRFYPLEEALADPAVTEAEILEKTDIGGPTLLRAAAKGRRLAMSEPSQIDVLEQWYSHGAPDEEYENMVLRFAAAAERRVADYVDASASYWESKVA